MDVSGQHWQAGCSIQREWVARGRGEWLGSVHYERSVVSRHFSIPFLPMLIVVISSLYCTTISMNPTGIVELHKNGKIWAESEGEGFGCTFFVQLPLHSHNYSIAPSPEDMPETSAARRAVIDITPLSIEQPDDKQSEVGEEHRSVTSPPPPAPVQPPVAVLEAMWKPTILVVDDSAMNRKMLVRMLISKGFACREAEDGIEGLSEVSRMYWRHSKSDHGISRNASHLLLVDPPRSPITPPPVSLSRRGSTQQQEQEQKEKYPFTIDAVLIDSNMPRMGGKEAIVEMRKIGFRGPIIGVSGGDEKTMKEFLKAGADNVMQKPAQSDKLVHMLLTGFQLVVQEARSRTLEQSLSHRNVRASEQARQEHIKRLQKFIEEADAAAVKK